MFNYQKINEMPNTKWYYFVCCVLCECRTSHPKLVIFTLMYVFDVESISNNEKTIGCRQVVVSYISFNLLCFINLYDLGLFASHTHKITWTMERFSFHIDFFFPFWKGFVLFTLVCVFFIYIFFQMESLHRALDV